LGGAPIRWKTRKQPTVALSSCEAEFMAIAEGTTEILYLQSLCTSLGIYDDTTMTTIYTDNQGALSFAKGDIKQHQRTKHIDVRYHFIREQDTIHYKHIPGYDNLADALTKPLAKLNLQKFTSHIGLSA
jgi:hypothetical protein